MRVKANWLDRAIAYVAPGAARDRLKARASVELMTGARAYDGAAGGRRGANWVAAGTAADAEVHGGAAYLRNRMRELVRNNPHAAAAVDVIATHLVGDGITARSNTGNEALDRKVMALWNDFRENCDPSGQLSFEAMQTLCVREMVEGGEVLVRRRPRRASDGLTVPLQLQIVEADLLDATRVGPMDNGNFAIQGVEFDKLQRRQNYWLFPAHPGNNYLMYRVSLLSVRIPASDVIHIYEQQRTQTRGAPWGGPVVLNLRDLDEYEEAEAMRKKIESCSVGVVTGGDETDMSIGISPDADTAAEFGGVYDSSNTRVEQFEPGMFYHLRGGRQITFHSPAATGSFEAYKRVSLQTVAAGFRIPYELLAGDLAHVSYISGRLGLQKFYRLMSQVQRQIIIPLLCKGVWRWFIDACIASGKLPVGDYPVLWMPPPMPVVNPLDEVQADILRVRAGLVDMPTLVTKWGCNPHDLVDAIESWNKLLDDKGFILDTDPRNVAKTGVVQPSVSPDQKPDQKVAPK